MLDLIKTLNEPAGDFGWRVMPIPSEEANKMSFDQGVELISPGNDLRPSAFESGEEVFCDLGRYGRFESQVSANDRNQSADEMLGMIQDIFETE